MRVALLTALLASTALAGGGRFERTNSRTPQGRSDRGLLGETPLAFFEFAPNNGAGMGSACACTVPTGAKGEALTFTRSGSATCSKVGAATTGIANGDIVTCSGNQPRIEPSGGAMAVRMEAPRTNSIVQSEAIDNAAWTKGPAVGTITANFAVAPDGTTTAERYQYTNTNNDYVLQGFGVGGVAATASVYLRGNGVNGTINLCRGGGVGQCVTCSYVSTSWSRCVYAGTLAASNNVFLGCETSTLGGACAQTGLDVLVWGFQGEVGGHASSYIATAGASATRNAEALSLTSFSLDMTNGSFALTSAALGLDTLYGVPLGLTPPTDGWQYYNDYSSWNGSWSLYYNGAAINTSAIAAYSGTQRLASWRTGGSVFFNINGTQGSAVRSGVTTVTGVTIGGDNTANDYYSGHISRVCIDPNASRCR